MEGILYRRDLISLTGRRRHGKTTLLHNLAIAGGCRKEYLGYRIPKPFRTVSFYLEDDGREVQEKLRRMVLGERVDTFELYVRQDFANWGILVSIRDEKFKNRVLNLCTQAQPDLIVFDNLGMLIKAKYTDAEEIHSLMLFTYELTQKFNAAVLIAAHPRKGSKLDNGSAISLRCDPDSFFEECMGSSHFINSTGSLWGIERNGDRTDLLLGAQRYTGTHSFTVVEKSENDWFERVDELALAELAALNTETRRKAWKLLPAAGASFSYVEARDAVKSGMKSASTFNHWWQELRRQRLVLDTTVPERYQRVKLPSDDQGSL